MTMRSSDPLYRAWPNAVKRRDNWACQTCGSNKSLHAHHVVAWAEDESLRYDEENGITLCRDCHSKHHPIMARLEDDRRKRRWAWSDAQRMWCNEATGERLDIAAVRGDECAIAVSNYLCDHP